MGHTDVVTVDPKKWAFPPFSATRDGGYVYGRGSLDDKPHVVAGLMLLLELKRLDVPLDRDVIFLAESGEEGTTGVGIDFMTTQHAADIRAEYCFAEGGNVTRVGGKVKFASVQAAEKVPRPIELTAVGPSGHASIPLQSNAIVHLSAAQALESRQLRPLAVTSKTRSQLLSDIPTTAEAGYPEIEGDSWVGLLVPAGTPREIIDALHREIARIIALPDVKARLPALGFEAVGSTPEEFAARIKAETEIWGKVIRAANIKPE